MFATLATRCRWLAWMVTFPVAALAQVAGGDVVLAQNARMTLTRADYDAAVARLVPEQYRPDFASRTKLIDSLLNALLVRYTLAAEARELGLDREPLPPDADANTVLAERMTARLDAEARADFDRRIDVFTARAREEYLVTRKSYVLPEEVAFSLIFVDATTRGDDAAMQLASKVRADLLNGASIEELARQYSDDKASAANGGRVTWVARAGMDPWLAKTVFEVKEVGETSEVVRAKAGSYFVRLDGKRPGRQQTFDEVKEGILAKMKEAHVKAQRGSKVEAISKDPGLRINQPAIDALYEPGDPEAIRRALRNLPPELSPN
jgi:parvulin-like peptidyl-prolyl isomerase